MVLWLKFKKINSPFTQVFLKTHENTSFTGRAVARIFHGLWSPAYPYAAWCKNHFWYAFNSIATGLVTKVSDVNIPTIDYPIKTLLRYGDSRVTSLHIGVKGLLYSKFCTLLKDL